MPIALTSQHIITLCVHRVFAVSGRGIFLFSPQALNHIHMAVLQVLREQNPPLNFCICRQICAIIPTCAGTHFSRMRIVAHTIRQHELMLAHDRHIYVCGGCAYPYWHCDRTLLKYLFLHCTTMHCHRITMQCFHRWLHFNLGLPTFR